MCIRLQRGCEHAAARVRQGVALRMPALHVERGVYYAIFLMAYLRAQHQCIARPHCISVQGISEALKIVRWIPGAPPIPLRPSVF